MISWHTGWHAFFQISPIFVPVAFNTALCHSLCGISLLTAQRRQKWPSILCICFVAIFSFIIGIQYLIGIDLGVDRIFMDQKLQIRSSYPGRMAPNTVLYFFLVSASLLSWHWIKKREIRLTALILLGMTVLLLSLIAILGYVIKVESAYSWWGMSDMAFLTAIGFFGLSIGILGLANVLSHEEKSDRMRFWYPVLAASIGVTLTLLIVQSLLINERNDTQKLAAEQSSRAAHIIQIEMANDIRALIRMQDRLNTSMSNQRDAWVKDAANYISDNPAYRALALMDAEFQIYEAVSGKPSGTVWEKLAEKKSILEAAKKKGGTLTSLKLDMPAPSSGKLLIFLLPLHKEDYFHGFLAAVYDIKEELALLPPAGHGLQSYLEIADQDGVIFSNKTDENYIWNFSHDEEISFYGMTWRIRETMNGSHPENRGLVILIFIAGISLSLLLAKAMWQTEKIRRYSEVIKKSDDLYTRATSAAQIGLWDWDLEKNELDWGGRAWEIFHAGSNEELWRDEATILGLIPESDRAEVRNKVFDSIEKDRGFNVDYRTKRMDGREIWVQSRGKVADWRDRKPLRISGTLIDITAQKLAEQELKRSNLELERFAYVASHDLKAPLRSIDNLAKWVVEDTKGVLPPDAQEKLGLLRGRVARLEVLLDDILAYSRAGRIVDDPVEIDTRRLVESIAQTHMRDSFKVTIIDPMPVLFSPKTPLEQVFGNLISNASKHHDRASGTITVSARDKGDSYEFIVSDDGPGIPPEFHERVFEMFQTLQPRDKVDGSGMGMAIIKKLVEWRGGRVWIESVQGVRGTAIHFLWPKK